MADFWWDVYHYYIENPFEKQRALHVISSLFYQNQAKQLSEEISQDLYGDHYISKCF